jgi:hypothetical protein
VGWSKTYLQLTRTTCLTKHKPNGNEEKQKREAKTGSAVRKNKKNKTMERILFIYFIK